MGQKKTKNLGKRGFTLLEIIIVVAIIAFLAVIAISNVLRARHNANETAVIGVMRHISTAFENYRAAQTPPTYPPALVTLIDVDPPYLDVRYSDGEDKGYSFNYTSDNANVYTLITIPLNQNITGTRSFFVDETGVIRASATGTADVNSTPL